MLSGEVVGATVVLALIAYGATCMDDFCNLVKYNGQAREKQDMEYRNVAIGFSIGISIETGTNKNQIHTICYVINLYNIGFTTIIGMSVTG